MSLIQGELHPTPIKHWVRIRRLIQYVWTMKRLHYNLSVSTTNCICLAIAIGYQTAIQVMGRQLPRVLRILGLVHYQ
uniref:Uncharacterized protein n=1 Tax=Arundo donax TaxID=35708 RepID=A0A0A9D6K2_ARUDO